MGSNIVVTTAPWKLSFGCLVSAFQSFSAQNLLQTEFCLQLELMRREAAWTRLRQHVLDKINLAPEWEACLACLPLQNPIVSLPVIFCLERVVLHNLVLMPHGVGRTRSQITLDTLYSVTRLPLLKLE